MAGWTNRGKYRAMLKEFGSGAYTLRLISSSSTTPGPTTNTISELTEIASGNGYSTGGLTLSGGTSDFVIQEDDLNNCAIVTIKDCVWTAVNGSIPTSGDPIRYVVLVDSLNNVLTYWDLLNTVTVPAGKTLTVTGFTIKFTE